MFNKKISVILLTLVFMLSVSAVCAVDSNSTDEILTSEEVEPPSMVLQNSTNDEITQQEDNYVLSSEGVEMYHKDKVYFTASLTNNGVPVANEKLIFTILGKNYTKVTNELGQASLLIGLNPGNYVGYVSYGNLTDVNSIVVKPLVSASDVTTTYKHVGTYTAKFIDSSGKPLANKYVKFIICGKTYSKKTNSQGVATLSINLGVGSYVIQAVHPNGYKHKNKVTVKSSITASNIVKHYKSSKVFSAKFYGKNGKVLAYKTIKFYSKGTYFYVKTNSKGVATIKIISPPGKYSMRSINTGTGEKKTNTFEVLPTLEAKSMSVFSGVTSKFKVTLYKGEKLAQNANMYVYVNGVKKTAKTDANGVATVSFKLNKGTYYFKSVDPYTGYTLSTKVVVKLASIKADDLTTKEGRKESFKATLLKQDGKVAADTEMQITINGVEHIVKTDANGVASVSVANLTQGEYKVVCKDLSTGYTLTKKITIMEPSAGKAYDKFGVSEDGKTLLVIGRPSAAGETSKYGYYFYKVELVRTCSYCGSHELYWSIFWAKDEYTDYGQFPETPSSSAHGEGGSCEGLIICTNCDSDWSVFGHNHGGIGGDLTMLSEPVRTTKDMAYLLKSGNYIDD